MEIRWRKNPKTPDGWPKRFALSLLSALAIFLLSIPVSFRVALNHLQSAYPGDAQNLLAALTSAVLVGLIFAAVCFVGVLFLLYLVSLRGPPSTE